MSGIGLLNRWRLSEYESGIATARSNIQCVSLILSLKEGKDRVGACWESEFNLNFNVSLCVTCAINKSSGHFE